MASTVSAENSLNLVPDARTDDGHLKLLHQLSRTLSGSTEIQPLAQRVLPLVAQVLSADVADLHLLQAGHLVIRGHHQSFAHPELANAATHSLRSLEVDENTLAGRALLARKPVTASQAQWPPRTSEMAAQFQIRRGIAVPLLSKDVPVGTLALFRRRDIPFSEREQELLQTCAAQIGFAVDYALLFEAQRKQMDSLRLITEVSQAVTKSHQLPEILEIAAANLARVVEATDTFIWLYDSRTGRLKGVYTSARQHLEHFRAQQLRPEDVSLAYKVASTLQPMQVEDALSSDQVHAQLRETYGARAVVGVPLFFGDQVIGAALMMDSRGPRSFTQLHLEHAMVLASQLGIAVANARLIEDLKSSYGALSKAQESIVRSERLAALGELAAVVAHEVRNPLGVIYNSLASLRRLLKPEGEAQVLFNFVKEESERLNAIVGDLLDFARPRDAELRPLLPVALIQNAARAVEAESARQQVRVIVDLAEKLPPVLADERMMRQALINLLLNAVQAMPKGGTLKVQAYLDGTALRIDTLDTGPGIPSELGERIFQPFFTTKATGSGLGLAVVKRVMDAHNGRIWVDAAHGPGAKLSLTLPLASEG